MITRNNVSVPRLLAEIVHTYGEFMKTIGINTHNHLKVVLQLNLRVNF